MRAARSTDIVGQRFGRLSVVAKAERLHRKNRAAVWSCKCDCGGVVDVRADNLRSGKTKSCGCLSGETAKAVHTKHGGAAGFSVTREYQAWINMRARCSGKQPKSWKNYGGRGIGVCREWDESYEAFFAHVGFSPGRGYELDRIDNDAGYEPGNVRWVTKEENNKNRRPRQPSRAKEQQNVS
jgi:hypothetical protein